MSDEFPSNSYRDQPEGRSARKTESKTKTEKVIRQTVRDGKVVVRKKPLRRKFLEAFRPEDSVGFVEHILIDVLAESIKSGIHDMIIGTVDNAFGVSSRPRGGRGRGYTSYSSMSRSRRDDREDHRRDERRAGRRRDFHEGFDERELIFDTRVEAEDTLEQLIEVVSSYDVVSVRDLLSMMGERSQPTDEDWGWRDLRGAKIQRINGGDYLLDLPRVESL